MNEILSDMASDIQTQFAAYLPKAYQTGRIKAERKYGVISGGMAWDDRDNANIALLLNRHAEELSKSMANAEQQVNDGKPINEVIQNFIGRVSSWSWALFPAMALGMAAFVDDNRQAITETIRERQPDLLEPIHPSDIGIIWHTAGDGRVCKICDFLNGRWFDAKEAYDIAAKTHPGCRCGHYFDVGTPDEALVGPIDNYHPGSSQDIYRDLHVHGLAQARNQTARRETNRVRRQNTPRAQVFTAPITKERLNKIRRQNIPRGKI